MDQHERKLIAIVRKFVIWYLILGKLLMHYIHYIFSDEKKNIKKLMFKVLRAKRTQK